MLNNVFPKIVSFMR